MKKYTLFVTGILLFFCFVPKTYAAYQYSRSFTATTSAIAIPGTLINYPALIDISTSTLEASSSGGYIQNADGYDINFFSDPACTNAINYQRESYSSSTGAFVGWLALPTLNTSTVVYMCFDNPAITTDQSSSTAPWVGDDYVAVYHFSNGTSLDLNNSTGGFNNLTNNGSTATLGQIGGGINFNGTQYAQNTSPSGLPTGTAARTLSLWFKMASNTGQIMGGWGANSNTGDRWDFYWPGGSGITVEGDNAGADINMAYDTNWHYLVATSPSGNSSFASTSVYLDGVQQTLTGANGSINTSGANVTVGTLPGAANAVNFNGSVDEMRIAGKVISANQVATDYWSQVNNANFWTVSAIKAPSSFFSLSPSAIPVNHSGPITLALTGIDTNWIQGTTVFSLSGVPNIVKVSQDITSTSTATVVVTTGAGTGTLVINDGTVSSTVEVSPATLMVSPVGGTVSGTTTVSFTGSNTVWSQEATSSLFTVSGGVGASIGAPTVMTNTSATAVLTLGSAIGTLMITDNSTGATTTFSVNAPPDFTITTPTTAIGAGTPSRAITLKVTSSSVGSAAVSFTLSDNDAGGIFYPSSTLSIPANAPIGTSTQFVYMPPSNASGTITIQAVATGGIIATHQLILPIGTATKFVYDTYTGAPGTNLTNHTPNIGAKWIEADTSGGSMNKYLSGSGTAYDSGTGHVYGSWLIPTAASSSEQDVAVTISNINNSTTLPDVSAFVANANNLTGYRFLISNGSYVLLKYINNVGSNISSAFGTVVNGSTHTLRLAIRDINGLQYLFPIVDGNLIDGAFQDSSITTGYPGHIGEIAAGETPSATDSNFSDFTGYNVDWTPSTPATSYTLTGPTSTIINETSSSFTVIPNGIYTGTITPSDNGTGGTFTPSSLNFVSSSAAQTFTYTPIVPGSVSINVSSSPTLTNPSPILITVDPAPLVVTFPNSNIYESPDVWRSSGTSIITPTGGAYLKFKITGTTQITANVDTTLNTGLSATDMPTIKVMITTATTTITTSTWVQFPANNNSNTPVQLYSGLNSSTTYSVSLFMIGGNEGATPGYLGTTSQTKINSLSFDAGASLSSPSVYPNTCIFWGDSILQSYFGGENTGAPSGTYPGAVDYTQAWPSFVSSSTLKCEYSQVGVGGQGWVNPGQGNYPSFGSSWNQYDSTHVKTFSPPPTYVIIDEGTNDHGQATTTIANNVETTLTAMRSTFGTSTVIFVITPYNPTFDDSTGAPRVGIIAGYNAYEASSSDANTFLIDLGTTAQQYALSPYSYDNIHPDLAAHPIIAGIIGRDIANVLPLSITSFSLPASSTSLTVPINSFITNSAAAGYYLSEFPVTPSSTNPEWASTMPSSYTFQRAGSNRSLYAWVKNQSGGISPLASTTIFFPYFSLPATNTVQIFSSPGIVTSTGPSTTSTKAITFSYAVHIPIGGGMVTIPAGTTFTAATTTDFTKMVATTTVPTSALPANSTMLGAIQYGLASSSISLNQSVTISIPVSTSYNGQTLPVYSSEDGGVSWTSLTTCTIASGC